MQRVEHCEQGVPGEDASPGLQRPEHREQDAAEDDAQPRYAARAAPRRWSSAAGRAAARLPHRGAEAAPLPLRTVVATDAVSGSDAWMAARRPTVLLARSLLVRSTWADTAARLPSCYRDVRCTYRGLRSAATDRLTADMLTLLLQPYWPRGCNLI